MVLFFYLHLQNEGVPQEGKLDNTDMPADPENEAYEMPPEVNHSLTFPHRENFTVVQMMEIWTFILAIL